ncbi:MAG: TIGR04282 family arsenosugar biosynthesis glycosyltransferase [Cyclobacteriaceae bacterium]
MKNILIIFVKNPEKGKVKTRLAKDIGEDKALEVYKRLLQHTHDITVNLDFDKRVYYSKSVEQNDIWEDAVYDKYVQSGRELGDKMEQAFQSAFKQYASKVCIIGSDCLELSGEIISHAFNQLDYFDYVVGPAKDGGYYLLGMTTHSPQLFQNKTYSTNTVCAEAISEIQQLGGSHYLLPELSDIDHASDLNR